MKYIYEFSNYLKYQEQINEGLLKTNNLYSTVNSAETYFLGLKFKFEFKNIDYNNNTFKLKISDFNYIQNIRNILEVIDSFLVNVNGYFPAKVYIEKFFGNEIKPWNNNMWNNLIKDSNNILSIEILFESKFDAEYIPQTTSIYHLTSDDYLTKILKHGLSPKAKNKIRSHPDRIYLCENPKDCETLISKMRLKIWYDKQFNDKNNKKETFSIVEIKFSSGKDNLNIKYYKDPNYTNGFYTYSYIPAKFISLYKTGL